jgi:tetratricopeptide (TPR) repeat protein
MNEPANRTVNNLRKNGDLQGAWDFGFKALQGAPQDNYLKGSLFWVCYELLKQQLENLNRRANTSNNYRPSDFEFEQIENLLQTIVNLEIATGGLEYKMLLVQFKKSLEWFPSLVHLVLRHQSALFDDDTKKPFQAEKGEVPSLMLSTARQVASAWLRARDHWQLDLDLVLAFLNQTREQTADTKHMIWLDYDQAKCLVVAGQYEQARNLILPILRKKQTESWAWGALAATYTNQDKHLAMKFFAKGIVSAHDVTFSLRLLQGIIPLLLSNQQSTEASMCLKLAISTYEKNGWKVKPELQQQTQQEWFDSSVDETNLNSFLKLLCTDAIDYLHGPLETVKAIVENIHKSGKGFQAFIDRSTSLPVRMGVHKSKEKPSAGDYVELSLSITDDGKEVVNSTLSKEVAMDDVSFVEGVLRIAPKGFGFVEETFVPAFLIGNLANEATVRAMRIMAWDKSKSRHNWKAIKLTELNTNG